MSYKGIGTLTVLYAQPGGCRKMYAIINPNIKHIQHYFMKCFFDVLDFSVQN